MDAVDLAIGVTGNTGAVHARLGWLSGSILSFAVGCAASALLYWLVGFWCLAVPTIVAAVAVHFATRQGSERPSHALRVAPVVDPAGLVGLAASGSF